MKKYAAFAVFFVFLCAAVVIGVALLAIHRPSKRATTKDKATTVGTSPTNDGQALDPVLTPTASPSIQPTTDTKKPTFTPTLAPTHVPSSTPTATPTLAPTNHPTSTPTTRQPTEQPTRVPTNSPTATPYFPGDLTVIRQDAYGRRVTMSTGMEGRAIAYSWERVQYTGGWGGMSYLPFHSRPDGAGVFPSSSGGFYYVSNSEVNANDGGGVYVLEFNAEGNVIGYFKTLTGSNNCGGGKTPWNTWVSCEENGDRGFCHQTDPSGQIASQRTSLVTEGGNYESFAHDVRDPLVPRFFVTEDTPNGALVRFTPDAAGLECFNSEDNANKWCTLNSGTHTYLQLHSSGSSGSFSWVSNKNSATGYLYPNAEGIDVVDGILFFTSKTTKTLFELDLDRLRFTRTSTVSGAFNLEPDQIKAIVNDPNEIIYFCEDGGQDCDIHGRDREGKYFTIVRGTDYSTETTGLGFSPDAKFMFVAFQEPGVIWQFWRSDGLPFTGNIVDIKYHAEQARRRLGGRFQA